MNRATLAPRPIAALSGLALLMGAALLGCGNADAGRAAVSGKVAFDGQPLPTGQIAFEPQGPGRFGIAQIVDGAYQMPSQQGPTPGKYIVRITADRPSGKPAAAPPAGGRPAGESYEQYIPAKYNERSELSIEIAAGATAVHDFDLTSK
jgi:hypothetical protein